jgi:hypothetical protein
MKHSFFAALIFSLVFLAHSTARAVILDNLPNAMMQGGMVHIDVTFLDDASGTFASTLEFGGVVVPDMKPISLWMPGDTVNPSRPWYSLIDPTRNASMFSSRWGLRVDTDSSDILPPGRSIGIRMTSSTPNLGAYFYNTSGAGTFQPVFLTPGATHDYVLWNGLMWHPYFAMPANTPAGSPVSATFEFFLADQDAAGFVDWTTTANALAGYSIGSQTITWTAIPEPGSAGLLAAGLLLMHTVRKKRRWPN